MLFLEADEETLVKRYKFTRRRHPLSAPSSVLESIRDEREMLRNPGIRLMIIDLLQPLVLQS